MLVLVLGGSGQLGAELRARAPRGIRALTPTHRELDITDAAATAAFVAAEKPHWIINAAAYTAVDKAESEPALARRINADGPRHLALAARAQGARLIQISTDFVFDGRSSRPYLPTDTPRPVGAYGQTKLAGEQAVAEISRGDALIIRTAWLYSVHGNNFVKTMLRLLHERPELRVVADQVGTPTSATSLASAVWRFVERDVVGGVYHYTDAGVASWYDLAMAVRDMAQTRQGRPLPPIVPIRTQDYPTPAQRPAYSVLDKTTAYAAVGTAPHWRDALAGVMQSLT